MLKAGLLRSLRAHLERGGVVAYATESCFGLGCDPRNLRAVRRVLRIKRRPQNKGLILIADRLSRLAPYVSPLDAQGRQRVLAKWPGPHTWLLPASRKTLRAVRGSHEAIAVRVTAHRGAAELCRRLHTALVSTSANRAGLEPVKTYRECQRQFGARVLVVPGRVGRRRRPSTIQDFATGKILRK